jgi:hypothetical protein
VVPVHTDYSAEALTAFNVMASDAGIRLALLGNRQVLTIEHRETVQR